MTGFSARPPAPGLGTGWTIVLSIVAAIAIAGASGMLVNELARMDRQFAMEGRV